MNDQDEGFCEKCKKVVKSFAVKAVLFCSICFSVVIPAIPKHHIDDEPVREYSVYPEMGSHYISGATLTTFSASPSPEAYE